MHEYESSGVMNLHESFQFATSTIFLALRLTSILVGVWLFRGARKLEQDIEEKVEMVRAQVRQIHEAEYVKDSSVPNNEMSFDSKSPLLLAYDYLATCCDEIYHPDSSWGGLSLDQRVRCQFDPAW